MQVKVAVSLEASVASLAAFEAKIVENNAIKILRAIERAVIAGDGDASGQPKGIINSDVQDGQTVKGTMTDYSSFPFWASVLAKVPLAYSSSVEWCFNKADYITYIQGMVDENGQPVARTNYGIHGAIDGAVFLGRNVIFVEDYGLGNFNTTEEDSAVGFLVDFSTYWFNSNMAMRYRKYFDEDTDAYYHKSTLLGDGKLTENYSLVLITKSMNSGTLFNAASSKSVVSKKVQAENDSLKAQLEVAFAKIKEQETVIAHTKQEVTNSNTLNKA